ncbi:MAG: hypothetical protein KDA78_12825 [Planctomycetaceae bacterium]|nr:hypothetical protein [Planctomycetaceae bacterium]
MRILAMFILGLILIPGAPCWSKPPSSGLQQELIKTRQSQFERMKRLHDEGAASASQVDEAEEAWLRARLSMEQKQQKHEAVLRSYTELLRVAERKHQRVQNLAAAGVVTRADQLLAEIEYRMVESEYRMVFGQVSEAVIAVDHSIQAAEQLLTQARQLQQAGVGNSTQVEQAEERLLKLQEYREEIQTEGSL